MEMIVTLDAALQAKSTATRQKKAATQAEDQSERDQRRVVIEGVYPEIDCGRFPIKRTVSEAVAVEADAYTDGHDAITCVLLYRQESASAWSEVAMTPLVNDRWRAEFVPDTLGRYRYAVQAWVDHFKSWARDLAKRVEAGQEVTVDLKIGAGLV
jgi:starch synthase (maltosyl-transferring)